jgi:hypothetical protein
MTPPLAARFGPEASIAQPVEYDVVLRVIVVLLAMLKAAQLLRFFDKGQRLILGAGFVKNAHDLRQWIWLN